MKVLYHNYETDKTVIKEIVSVVLKNNSICCLFHTHYPAATVCLFNELRIVCVDKVSAESVLSTLFDEDKINISNNPKILSASIYSGTVYSIKINKD